MGNNKQFVPEALWALARQQSGVLSHRQATQAGLSRNVIHRLLGDRIWWPVTRGLYSVAPDVEWEGLAWGGVLLGGDGAVITGRAAAHLHGLAEAPKRIEVSVPRRAKDRGAWVFVDREVEGRGAPLRATVERAVLEFGATLADGDALGVVADAIVQRRTTVERLAGELTRLGGAVERGAVAEAVRDVQQGVMSQLERRFAEDVLRAHNLPEPVRQAPTASGLLVDNWFEEASTVVELDGRLGHMGAAAWKDHRRDNRNMAKGLTTLRYGWADVIENPCAVAGELARVLTANGWWGMPSSCPCGLAAA